MFHIADKARSAVFAGTYVEVVDLRQEGIVRDVVNSQIDRFAGIRGKVERIGLPIALGQLYLAEHGEVCRFGRLGNAEFHFFRIGRVCLCRDVPFVAFANHLCGRDEPLVGGCALRREEDNGFVAGRRKDGLVACHRRYRRFRIKHHRCCRLGLCRCSRTGETYDIVRRAKSDRIYGHLVEVVSGPIAELCREIFVGFETVDEAEVLIPREKHVDEFRRLGVCRHVCCQVVGRYQSLYQADFRRI